jgi:hypothetical protein
MISIFEMRTIVPSPKAQSAPAPTAVSAGD